MKKELVLRNPIMLNGKKTSKLTYDTSAITITLFSEAEKLSIGDNATSSHNSFAPQTDYTFQFYIGCAAIVAANPSVDFQDLALLRGYDIMEVSNIGKVFTWGLTDAEAKTLESSIETTPEPSSQA